MLRKLARQLQELEESKGLSHAARVLSVLAMIIITICHYYYFFKVL